MTLPKPRTPAPPLEVATLDGGTWRLADSDAGTFTMVVFYRGIHCPICKTYLRDLDRRAGEFAKRRVAFIAVSGDDRERAAPTAREWGLENVPIGYGQTVESMRAWGLYLSRAIKDSEPAMFAEPGLFLVRPDGTLYYAAINSAPFARPSFAEILQAIDFVTANDYPARGEA